MNPEQKDQSIQEVQKGEKTDDISSGMIERTLNAADLHYYQSLIKTIDSSLVPDDVKEEVFNNIDEESEKMIGIRISERHLYCPDSQLTIPFNKNYEAIIFSKFPSSSVFGPDDFDSHENQLYYAIAGGGKVFLKDEFKSYNGEDPVWVQTPVDTINGLGETIFKSLQPLPHGRFLASTEQKLIMYEPDEKGDLKSTEICRPKESKEKIITARAMSKDRIIFVTKHVSNYSVLYDITRNVDGSYSSPNFIEVVSGIVKTISPINENEFLVSLYMGEIEHCTGRRGNFTHEVIADQEIGNCFAYLDDGSFLVGVGQDREGVIYRHFETADGTKQKEIVARATGGITAIKVFQNNYIIAGTTRGGIYGWRLGSNQTSPRFKIGEHEDSVTGLHVNKNGIIFSSGLDGTRIWDGTEVSNGK